jgi:hypothetical protein
MLQDRANLIAFPSHGKYKMLGGVVIDHGYDDVEVASESWLGSRAHGKPTHQRPSGITVLKV